MTSKNFEEIESDGIGSIQFTGERLAMPRTRQEEGTLLPLPQN